MIEIYARESNTDSQAKIRVYLIILNEIVFKLNKLKVKLKIFNDKNIKNFFLSWNTKINNLIDEIGVEKCGFEF